MSLLDVCVVFLKPYCHGSRALPVSKGGGVAVQHGHSSWKESSDPARVLGWVLLMPQSHAQLSLAKHTYIQNER